MSAAEHAVAVLAAARAEATVAEDVDWMQDTAARIQARYSLALLRLAEVPAPLGDLGRMQLRENAAEGALALEELIFAVISQLDAINEYLRAVAGSGPAYCIVCSGDVGIFQGSDVWEHFVTYQEDGVRRRVVEASSHAPVVASQRPSRPDWTAIEGDINALSLEVAQ